MNNFARRSLAMVLALVMCISLFASFAVTASAATVDYKYSNDGYIYNWGTREETATFLSPNAEAFYDDNNVTYDDLAALDGSSSTSSVPDSDLYEALYSLMAGNHDNKTSYDATRPLFQYTDCQGSARSSTKISSFYSGTAIGPAWDSGATWNREHCWPNSKSNGGSTTNTVRETDIMMLRPASVSENSTRGNKAYGESSGFYDPNEEGNGNYDLRGDVARIVLYVYVRWGGDSTYHDGALNYMWGSSGVIESKDVLLDWMEADPVDTWELARNDSVESITGTRNVFVDYPELAFLLFNEEIPNDMVTPSGEAMTPDFVITPTVNNSAYGSVTLSGITINATPAEGFEVAGYEVVEGNATVVQTGNTFTVTADIDCTIQINFAARKAVAVEFVENGKIVSSEIAYADDVITLADLGGNCNDGYVFLGWVTDAWEETVQAPTTVYAAGTNFVLDQDVSFHALYSRVDTSAANGNTYALATDLAEGDYLIIAESAAMKAEVSDKIRFNYTDIVVVNGHIDAPAANLIWHIAPTEDGYYTIYNASTNSYAGSNGYADANGILLSSVTDYAKWSITLDGNGIPVFENLGCNNKSVNSTLRKNSTFGFATYAPSSGSAPCLYEKTTHTVLYSTNMVACAHNNRQVQGQVDATCDASGSTGDEVCAACGTLLNANQPVAATGHIDANADGVCDSCKGTFSSYEKITSLSVGDTVLLVYEDAKMEFSKISNTSTQYGIGQEYTDTPAGVTPLTVVQGAKEGTVAFKFGDNYLYWSSGNSLRSSTELNNNASWTVTFDSTGNAIIINAGSSDRYLQWNSSSPRFACYTNTQKAVQLYGLVVTETPACQHSNTKLQNAVTVSCTVDGYTGDEVCTDCGETVTPGEVINSPGHSHKAVVTEPTLTEQGYTTYTCTVCGDTYVDDYTPALATAKIGENYYTDLSDALEDAKAGDTVTLLANAEDSYIIITPGVTLDLGSYTLTADYVIGLNGSGIVATAMKETDGVMNEYGKLVVDPDNISLASNAPDGATAGYKMIPAWNEDHYCFSLAGITKQEFAVEASNDGKATIKFQGNFTSYVKKNLFTDNGSGDNGMSVIVRVSYTETLINGKDVKVTREYYYTEELIQDMMADGKLTASLIGCDALKDLVFSIAFVTEAGVEVVSQDYVYADYIQ